MRRTVTLLLLSFLAVGSAPAFTAGRDYVPYSFDVDEVVLIGTSNFTVLDVFGFAGDMWVLYMDSTDAGKIKADTFDPSGATWNTAALTGSPVTLLTPDTTSGSVEAKGLNSAQIGLCSKDVASADTLVLNGGRYCLDHIGSHPPSITISGVGGTCQNVGVVPGSHVSGYKNGSTYITDSVQLQNTGTCTSFLANYSYTNCGFTGNNAYRCVMEPDPIADSDSEQGFCRFLMVYEARYDGDADTATEDDRVFLVAHAQHVDGQWERYLPSASGYPTTSDIRVQNTSRHNQDASANLYSFVSVPTLHYDETDGLWRMWFVTEDKGGHSVRYSESDDNGLSWGVGSWPGTTRDCWNGTAFSTSSCTDIDWTGTQPPDDTTGSQPDRSPDIVDPEVIFGNFDGVSGNEVGMMFTGGDDACANNTWGVQLWQLHSQRGDQSGGSLWSWETSVEADSTTGIVVDGDGGYCGNETVMDPEIVKYEGGWLAFFNGPGGIHLAASAYPCSNFADDDTDGDTDWAYYGGGDAGCSSPWDTTE